MAKKAPKLKKKYEDGGPVTEFSWDDYYKRLNAWKNAKAQNVPQDIADYESKWIVPQIKQTQTQLNAALAAKYNLQPGQAPTAKQFLTADEAKAVIGEDNYATYLTNVQGYQAYRDKVAGSYKAPKNTAGALDPQGEKYGPRHFGLFTPTQAQKDANVAATKAAGMPTTQAEADAIAAQPAKVTKTETTTPQDMTPSGGIASPPGKPYDWSAALNSPAQTGAQPANAGTAQPAGQATGAVQQPAAAPTPRYDKHVTNFGQTYYFVYDAQGKPQQITQQAYDSGLKSNPNAQQYLLDESTGLYDEQGQPKKPVLTNPVPAPAPTPEVPVEEKKVTTPAPPKMKKGGKVKGYALGGVVPPDSLTGDQLIAYEKLTTDADRQAYLDSVAAGTDGDIAPLTGKQKAIASIAAPAGNLAAAGVNAIDVDPLNKRGTVAQGAASGALSGAGQGLALGMNPLLLAATGGLSAPIGAAAGAIIGGVTGGKKGKKKFEAARSEADANAQQAAISASYQDSGYAEGGPIAGAGKKATRPLPSSAAPTPLAGVMQSIGDVRLNTGAAPYDPNYARTKEHLFLFGGDSYIPPMTVTQQAKGMNAGGKVIGAGTGKSDDIPATIVKGSFIVPAENAKMAEMLRKQYLAKDSGKAKLKQGGNTADVYLSNGEHMFTPSEVAILKKNGIDVDSLAPNSETTGYGYADGGTVSPGKARKILSDGKIRGKELTPKQKRYFGWIVGKGMKDGGNVGDPKKEGDKLTKEDLRGETQYTNGMPTNVTYEAPFTGKSVGGKRIYRVASSDGNSYHAYLNEDGTFTVINKVEFEKLSDGSSRITNTPQGKDATPEEIQAANKEFNSRFGVAPEPAKAVTPTPATTIEPAPSPSPSVASANTTGGNSGGGNGGSNGVASAPAKAAEVTPSIAEIQAAFIKEHGGIGSQNPADATPSATGAQATGTNAIDPLKKKWQELIDAGKTSEAAEIEKQMKAMGYRYNYDNATKKGDWVSAAGTSTGVTAPATGANAGMADLEAEDATVNTPTGVKPSPYKRIYETLGPGGLLGATQAGIGLIQAQKAKAPTLTGTQVDAGLQARADQAVQQSRYGLSAAEYSNAANRIESQRANVMRSLTNAAPGDIGAIVGNARQVAIDTNRSRLDLEAANERMRMAKEARADQLVGAAAQQRQQLFAQNLGLMKEYQIANAELVNAGLANLVGSINSRENQNRIDQRAEKYGNVNLTLGGYGG